MLTNRVLGSLPFLALERKKLALSNFSLQKWLTRHVSPKKLGTGYDELSVCNGRIEVVVMSQKIITRKNTLPLKKYSRYHFGETLGEALIATPPLLSDWSTLAFGESL